jgi:hypothetical protein
MLLGRLIAAPTASAAMLQQIAADDAPDQEGAKVRTSTKRKTARCITVLLVPKVAKDLAKTRKRERLSDTDIVNRAISLYNFIDEELTSGAQLLLRRPGNAEKEVQLR